MSVLTARGIYKTYDGRRWALNGVDLEIGKARIATLLGPNGAGKTTFVRIASTELLPTKGEVEILGVDAVRYPSRVRPLISIIPQEARPINFITAWEAIYSYLLLKGFSRGDAKRMAEWAMERLSLEPYRRTQLFNLSGGLKRRVLVAMALASNASLIFLDEPTVGLDIISRRSVWDALAELRRSGAAILLTTHYVEEAELLSDEVFIIDSGTIIRRGSPKDLLSLAPGDAVVEAYGDSLELDEPHVRLGNRYIIYVDSAVAGSLSTELIGRGMTVTARRKTLEDAVIYLLGGWREEGEAEVGSDE
ncbi:ABC transporter ATP-binding protein [Thermocladium modestius]|uniref:ABC transporter ATP-binding protein n=1 Tax=Thermocladium modestius TaxID=62609 RepID=A0A830GVB7_9CREN|nr:ABC transporter ATP-binding protein [Thermocladium modestius]GGP21486.1 ABC transporter ATP-binding protein [Thermocladium modestius]